jgi:hypothetical protein
MKTPEAEDEDELISLNRRVMEEHRNFQLSIGRLILNWSDLEGALYAILRHYAKVTDDVGRSIFSGCRAKQMIDFIENIAHNTKLDDDRRKDLSMVFPHINAINTMRDKVVHHGNGAEIEFEPEDPTTRYLTNERRVSRKDKAFRLRIGAKDIDNMSADVLDCCWHLLAHRETNPFTPWIGPAGKPYAWRYKPLQPSIQPSKYGAVRHTQPRQRKPSPE